MYNFILNRSSNSGDNYKVSLFVLLILTQYRHLLTFFNAPSKKTYQVLHIISINNKDLNRTAFKTRLFFSSS
jgi:hypothetical protein